MTDRPTDRPDQSDADAAAEATTQAGMPDANLSHTPGYLRTLFGLENATAVVIGGTGTLGAAFARALAGAGAGVVVCGRGEVAGQEVVDDICAAGGQAEMKTVDATKRDELEAIVEELDDEDRRCDVLINAAGINSATPYFEIGEDEWHKILEVNLTSVHLACQTIGRRMVAAGSGSIINVASMSAITPLSRVFTYSVSKAGVLNLTQNLAREFAPHGVRVNALSPGFFPAEQNREVLDDDRIATIMNHTPMARFGEPDELAGAVLLLASPVAGRFITGANMAVDGGFSAMTI